MNYGYFNCFITKIGEDVQAEIDELKAHTENCYMETLASRPYLNEIIEKLQPGDKVYVYSFSRFCSGLRDLTDLLIKIVDEKQADVISLHDDFDSSTEKGKIAKEVYARAISLMYADPSYGFYK